MVHNAGYKYSDPYPLDTTTTIGEKLLTPTRIYVKSLLKVIKLGLVKGLAHITGGGLVENIPRVISEGMGVKLESGSWEIPSVFKWLKSLGKIDGNTI